MEIHRRKAPFSFGEGPGMRTYTAATQLSYSSPVLGYRRATAMGLFLPRNHLFNSRYFFLLRSKKNRIACPPIRRNKRFHDSNFIDHPLSSWVVFRSETEKNCIERWTKKSR